MINKITLCNIRKETGLDYNNIKQVKVAICNVNFALRCLGEIKEEDILKIKENLLLSLNDIKSLLISGFQMPLCEDFKNNLLAILDSLNGLLKDSFQMAKYKYEIAVLKLRLLEINLTEDVKNIKKEDLISLIETLNEVCLIEMNLLLSAKENTLSLNDIEYKDAEYYYLNGNNKSDKVIVSRASYIAARVKNGIKYGVCYVGSKALKETSKSLNMVKKNKSI